VSNSGASCQNEPASQLTCGKMAAGKSTMSRELAERENAVLLVQDEFLERLFA
jgi:predicted kinase